MIWLISLSLTQKGHRHQPTSSLRLRFVLLTFINFALTKLQAFHLLVAASIQ